jgi:hypothetical protein
MIIVQEDLKKFYFFFHDVYIGNPYISMPKPISAPLYQYEFDCLKNIAILQTKVKELGLFEAIEDL